MRTQNKIKMKKKNKNKKRSLLPDGKERGDQPEGRDCPFQKKKNDNEDGIQIGVSTI